MQKDNYRLLIEKLDQFIRKYYVNRIIRGSLYSIALILVLFIGMNVLEYYNYFPGNIRKILLFSFLGVSGLALAWWVGVPLMHYFRLGKIISHDQAARIIGNHFGAIKDKLLNVLQLKRQAGSSGNTADLITASINQKSAEIRPVPFKSAINLQQNRKYLRYALPPLLVLVILLFAAPSVIKDSTKRLINNDLEFERPAPFRFVVEESDLEVVQFEDYELSVKVEGSQLPDQVSIDVDNYQYRLKKEAPNQFTYRFSNVQENTNFLLFSSGVRSREYALDVLKKPNIAGFDVQLDYPAYTQRRDESLKSIGDLVVPLGTKINWVFNAQNTDEISIQFAGADSALSTQRFSDELFRFKHRALKNEYYKLYISNQDLPRADSIRYSISVIPDLYPSISVEQFRDSVDNRLIYFLGEASDDYGMLNVTFNYRIKPQEGEQGELQTVLLTKPQGKQTQFEHSFDLNKLELKPGDEVTYYFQVADNDAINGSKKSRTNLMRFAKPTVEEYREMADQNEEKIKDELEKALEESRKIQEDVKRLREKLLQEKDMDWQSRKELEKLMKRQEELKKKIEEARESYQENLDNQKEYSESEENLMEKQEQLQKLFEKLQNEEMQELMKKIEELMQEMEKDQALEMMEDFQFSDEELEKELDRMLELFKQLEMEKEMTETIEKLEELSQKQEELSEETSQEKSPQEELEQQQEEINEEFEEVQEKMDSIEQKNQQLENPKNIGDQQQNMEDIQQQLNESQQQLQQQQNKKASESQKNAAQKMKEMAQSMSAQMQSGQMQQMQEDMQALRQLLENLVGLSFDQEDLLDDFAGANINTPKYVELVQRQFKLKDDFKLVDDSLQALSKRVFQIESFVTDKVTEIKDNMRQSIDDLEERRKLQASDHQQRSMKNLNDLALMLSEVMNQMQQQMAAMMSGSQMCNKPGQQQSQGQQPMDKITKGQQQLNEQMRKMREQMKKSGKGRSSEEFAKMAAKQAALRKALREKAKELQQRGQGSKELQELIEEMDKIETDLVNKKLTNEMQKRQEDILNRLLRHEKAERERGLDQKRKSEVAEQKQRQLPPSLEEYIKKREAEIEMYKTVSPALKPYYKSLVEEYFKSLKSSSSR